MRKFEMPQMTLIRLTNENIIYTSICTSKMCTAFCTECPCGGSYECGIYPNCNAYCTEHLCTEYEV